MRSDISTMLKNTTPEDLPPLDVDAAMRQGRRARTIRTTSLAAAGVGATAVIALAVVPGLGPAVRVDDPVLGAGGQTTAPSPDSSQPAAGSTPDEAELRATWDGLTLDDAVDRLILAADAAPEIDLPPAPGEGYRLAALNVAQESGYDGTAVDSSKDEWQLTVVESVTGPQGAGWQQSGTATRVQPADASIDRQGVRSVVETVGDIAMGERWRTGDPSAAPGTGWEFTPDPTVDMDAALDTWLTEAGDPLEASSGFLAITSVRTAFLERLPSLEGVAYEGIVVDLLGRPSVAFSMPFAVGDGGSDVRSQLLLSPETAAPHEWSRHDPTGTSGVEWRSVTYTAAEVVSFDTDSLDGLPAEPLGPSESEVG